MPTPNKNKQMSNSLKSYIRGDTWQSLYKYTINGYNNIILKEKQSEIKENQSFQWLNEWAIIGEYGDRLLGIQFEK